MSQDIFAVDPCEKWPDGIKIGDRVNTAFNSAGVIICDAEFEAERGSYTRNLDPDGGVCIPYRRDDQKRGYLRWLIYTTDIIEIVYPEKIEADGQLPKCEKWPNGI